MFGEERGGHDGQGRVLVAGRADGAAQRAAAFDEESHDTNLDLNSGFRNGNRMTISKGIHD
jgi:hypothetical protein